MEQLAQETADLLSTSAGLLVLILGAVAGLIVGLLFAAFGWKRKDDAVTNHRVEAAQIELKDYKNDVNQHFAKTATLVNQLTSDYRAVYDHLANSSAKLCDADELNLGFNDTLQLAQQDVKEQPSLDETASTEPKPEPSPSVDPSEPSETDTTQSNTTEKPPEAIVAASIPAKIPSADKAPEGSTAKAG